MKKIILVALLLTSISALAANWVYFDKGASSDAKYYYDSTNLSGRTVGDGGYWTWVDIVYPTTQIIDGHYYDESKSQWVYDCAGNYRVDDEIYYYNGSSVYQRTGKGTAQSVVPGTTGEHLKDILCE